MPYDGLVTRKIKEELESNGIQYTDLLKREEFSVLNTIATADVSS